MIFSSVIGESLIKPLISLPTTLWFTLELVKVFLIDGAFCKYAELKSKICFPENLYVIPAFIPYPSNDISSPFPAEFPAFASFSKIPSRWYVVFVMSPAT